MGLKVYLVHYDLGICSVDILTVTQFPRKDTNEHYHCKEQCFIRTGKEEST